MSVVNMLEAKTHLSRLVDAVESGAEKEVVIARNGKPAARLVPVEDTQKKIRLGLARGKYPSMSLEEFNALDEDIAKLFNEGSLFPEGR
jgi:prevent-host-death family protein